MRERKILRREWESIFDGLRKYHHRPNRGTKKIECSVAERQAGPTFECEADFFPTRI